MDGEQPQTQLPQRLADEALLVRAFVIADIRGYTRFTDDHGDEAAARLASTFAALTREAVEQFGGEVVELRGDEALCVFASTRQAIRAALDLQRRYGEHSAASPDRPLGVGIGIDAGEAVAVEGGFRGGALNLAARLCSIAGPGHVLASDAVTHLARKVEETRYVDLGMHTFKGLDAPVHIIEVMSESNPPEGQPYTLVRPEAAPPKKVPFADLGDRIEALVEAHLQQTLGKWRDGGQPGSAPPTFGFRDQLREHLTLARDAALEAKRTKEVLTQAPPAQVLPPPRPSRPQSPYEGIVAIVSGVVITLAILAVILVIVLKVV